MPSRGAGSVRIWSFMVFSELLVTPKPWLHFWRNGLLLVSLVEGSRGRPLPKFLFPSKCIISAHSVTLGYGERLIEWFGSGFALGNADLRGYWICVVLVVHGGPPRNYCWIHSPGYIFKGFGYLFPGVWEFWLQECSLPSARVNPERKLANSFASAGEFVDFDMVRCSNIL